MTDIKTVTDIDGELKKWSKKLELAEKAEDDELILECMKKIKALKKTKEASASIFESAPTLVPVNKCPNVKTVSEDVISKKRVLELSESEDEDGAKKAKEASDEFLIENLSDAKIIRRLDEVMCKDLVKFDELTCGSGLSGNLAQDIEDLRMRLDKNLEYYFKGLVWCSYVIVIDRWYELPNKITRCPIAPFRCNKKKINEEWRDIMENMNTEMYKLTSDDVLNVKRSQIIETHPPQVFQEPTATFRMPNTMGELILPKGVKTGTNLWSDLNKIKNALYYVTKLIRNTSSDLAEADKFLDPAEFKKKARTEKPIDYPVILTYHPMPKRSGIHALGNSMDDSGCFQSNHFHLLMAKKADIVKVDNKLPVRKGQSFQAAGVQKRCHLDTKEAAHIFMHHAQTHPKKHVVGVTHKKFHELYKYIVKKMNDIYDKYPEAELVYRCPSGKEYDLTLEDESTKTYTYEDFGIEPATDENDEDSAVGGKTITDELFDRIGSGEDCVSVVDLASSNMANYTNCKSELTVFDISRGLSGAGRRRMIIESVLEQCYGIVKPKINTINAVKDQIQKIEDKRTKHIYLSIFEDNRKTSHLTEFNRQYWIKHVESGPWKCILQFFEDNEINIISKLSEFAEWLLNTKAIKNEFPLIYFAIEIILKKRLHKRQNTLYVYGKPGLGKTRIFYCALEKIFYPINLLGTLDGNHKFQELANPAMLSVGDDLKPEMKDDMLAKMKTFLGGQSFMINPKHRDAISWTPTPVIWLSNQPWFSFPKDVNLQQVEFQSDEQKYENFVLHNKALQDRVIVLTLKNPIFKVDDLEMWACFWVILFFTYKVFAEDNDTELNKSPILFYNFLMKLMFENKPNCIKSDANLLNFRICLEKARTMLSTSSKTSLPQGIETTGESTAIGVCEKTVIDPVLQELIDFTTKND